MAQFRHSFLVVVHLVQVPFATKHEFVPVLFFVILWGETKHTHTQGKRRRKREREKERKREREKERRNEKKKDSKEAREEERIKDND